MVSVFTAIAIGLWALAMSVAGNLFSQLRTGMIILFVLLGFLMLLGSLFVDTKVAKPNHYYGRRSAGDELLSAMAPGLIGCILLLVIWILGGWISWH